MRICHTHPYEQTSVEHLETLDVLYRACLKELRHTETDKLRLRRPIPAPRSMR